MKKSLEKKPLKKSKPIRFIDVILKIIFENILKLIFLFHSRVSWLELDLWRIEPTLIKSKLLKKAWENKWKKTNKNLKFLNIKNKKPIWESVEKATIFLKSFS